MSGRWGQDLFSGAYQQDKRQQAQKQQVPSEYEEKLLYCKDDRVLAEAAQRGHEVPITGDVQKPLVRDPVQRALGDPAWAGGQTRLSPEVASNLSQCVRAHDSILIAPAWEANINFS